MVAIDDSEMRYALGHCRHGAVLVVGSNAGVREIALGDDPDELLSQARSRRAGVSRTAGDPDFEIEVLQPVVAFLDTVTRPFPLPLDPQGTPFQEAVWAELRLVPMGRTITYAELARRIGRPEAVRAVAGACGANRIAVAIPCHRAIGSDGSLAGYRWGVDRKRELLRLERSLAEDTPFRLSSG